LSSQLERMKEALQLCGVVVHGRNAELARKTKYSAGMVGKIMSGESIVTDKFIKYVSASYGINPEWIMTGEGLMFSEYIDGVPVIHNKSHIFGSELHDRIIKNLEDLSSEDLRDILKYVILVRENKRMNRLIERHCGCLNESEYEYAKRKYGDELALGMLLAGIIEDK
jgi:transcriptional regulator with XRE-family HTH domain